MAFGNSMNCGCCGSQPHGPPYCPRTIRLLDCGGSPLPGAAVTVQVPGFPDVVGATDADGRYTFPGPFGTPYYGEAYFNGRYYLRYDGVAAGAFFGLDYTVYNCTHTFDYCYRHARVTVNTTADADPAVLSTPVPMAQSDDGSGGFTLTYKAIAPCSSPPGLPVAEEVYVGSGVPAHYLDNCAKFTLHCGDDLVLNLPLSRWDVDYALRDCYRGCDVDGDGSDGHRLIPRRLFLTWDARDGAGHAIGSRYFGDLAGVPIEVDWDGTGWTRSCIADATIPCNPGFPYGARFRSALTYLTYNRAAGTFAAGFVAFLSATCSTVPPSGGCPSGWSVGLSGLPICSLAAPTDASFHQSPDGLVTFTLEITE